MLLVGCVNMVTSLLIIILEKSKFIGVLKALNRLLGKTEGQ